jgi:alkylhydroperoxidase family enzyme
VWATRPEFWSAYMALYSYVLRQADPVPVELCRLRMAKLIGSKVDLRLRYLPARRAGLGEEKIDGLALWPASPLFSDRERACLAVAEQFCIDSSAIAADDLDRLQGHLDQHELAWFAMALSRFDGFMRVAAFFDLDLDVDLDDDPLHGVPPGMTDFVLVGAPDPPDLAGSTS